MTSCVRVLSTQALDSFPSILLVAPNGKKILVNCGEGCQRIFLEFGQKVSTIDTVCLTHLGHETVGGLPGMILTASDVVKMATECAKQEAGLASGISLKKQKGSNKKGRNKHNNKNGSPSQPIQPGLKILGPDGTSKFFHSLRHFMRRDSFLIDIREGAYSQTAFTSKSQSKDYVIKKQRTARNSENNDSFSIQSFSAYIQADSDTATDTISDRGISPSRKRPRRTDEGGIITSNSSTTPAIFQYGCPHESFSGEILSFLFTTPPIQGRFLIEKAKALGVPRGPLYGELKAGKTVTFSRPSPNTVGESETVTVKSEQVVEPGSPGVVVAILCYPTPDVLDQLQNSKEVKQFRRENQEIKKSSLDHTSCSQKKTEKEEKPMLELVVHITTRSIFDSDACVTWRQSFFQSSVQHMFVRTEKEFKNMENEVVTQSLSVFHSAHSGARLRSKISHDIFRATLPEVVENKNFAMDVNLQGGQGPPGTQSHSGDLPIAINAVPLLEYILLPRAKRGFSNHDLFLRKWKATEEESRTLLENSGCIDRANRIMEESGAFEPMTVEKDESDNKDMTAEVLFTGTGSAVPCKHRNVSGIYVRMNNGNAMLLDVGEGTVGQLLRAKEHREFRGEKTLGEVLKKIKAVWISHPHADHHLGLIRLLEERKRIVGNHDPLVLIAGPDVQGFLREYETIVPCVAGSYIFLDCRTLKANFQDNSNATISVNHMQLKRLHQDLGIRSCKTIPVAHCANSFAVVFHGTSFGSIAYSGDCRPSKNFARIAFNADLLIHEATFADGMEADAVVKRHSTVGEALQVAKEMNAKTTILTHFSQRYPKIPIIRTSSNTENANTGNTNIVSSRSPLLDMRVIHAFDFMTITPSNLSAASKLTPAMQLLYPDKTEEVQNNLSMKKSDAQVALEVPGLFAQTGLL